MSNRIPTAGIVALVAGAALLGAGGFWTTGITAFVAAQTFVTSLSAPATGEEGDQGTWDDDDDQDDVPGDSFDEPPLAYEIGDCFMESDGDDGRVQFRDCSEPHDYEVYAEFEVPDTEDGSYPGDDKMSYAADEGCFEAFEDFVGVPWEESVYDFALVAPDEETWTEFDDRLVQCMAVDPDGAHTGSLEGVGE
ncbi:septum formation family protein [Herbiconiux sp. P15]|uniref:septum formation family protein n=1 Tax=Herbiconiux liukaitaii TaxID=3342799 RepID=UPI0035BAEA1F